MANQPNDRQPHAQRTPAPAGAVAPVLVAVGVAVALVGLLAAPLVVAPVGAAIAIAGGAAWSRPGPDRSRERVAAGDPGAPRRPEDRYSRGSFLGWATIAVGGLVALAVAVPVAGVAVLSSFAGRRRRPVDLGPLDAFPEGQYTVVRFLADPDAGAVSRRAAYVRNNGLLDDRPSFTILSSRCTHVGCPTEPNGPLSSRPRTLRTADGEVTVAPTQPAGFGCPCHGSQFDTEGNRTAGPAPRALDRYEFSIRNGRLYLGRLFSVSRVEGTGADARIHGFGVKGAGEPADGIEAWLYPVEPPT